MRVLFVNHMGFLGGGEKSMLSLMDGLRKTGRYQVLLLAPHGELADSARHLGFEVYEFPFEVIRRTFNPWTWLTGFVRLLRGLGEIRQVLVRERVDVLHANSLKAAVIGGLAARGVKTKTVFHTRDFLAAGIWSRPLTGLAYLLADGVICNAKSVAAIYGADPKHKVNVIYNAVVIDPRPTPAQREPLRKKLGTGFQESIIGYSGRLHPEKGIETLFDGFKRIQATIPGMQLWIIGQTLPGEEQYAEQLQHSAAAAGIAGCTKFWGWRRDALELMACCDVLVVPSKKEPFGRVTVEAMLLGIPVAATAAGGTLEIIEDGVTGLLFPPGNGRALADVVLRLLTDQPLRERIIERARTDATNRFGQQQYINGVERAYSELAGK